jgi:hypothetical protein
MWKLDKVEQISAIGRKNGCLDFLTTPKKVSVTTLVADQITFKATKVIIGLNRVRDRQSQFSGTLMLAKGHLKRFNNFMNH